MGRRGGPPAGREKKRDQMTFKVFEALENLIITTGQWIQTAKDFKDLQKQWS